MVPILVTRTNRGIGKAIAGTFDGHDLIGHSTNGGDGRVAADLGSPDAAASLWNEALNRLRGRIDVLINNAGMFADAPIDLESGEWLARWQQTMQVNLTAAAQLCRLAVTHFL